MVPCLAEFTKCRDAIHRVRPHFYRNSPNVGHIILPGRGQAPPVPYDVLPCLEIHIRTGYGRGLPPPWLSTLAWGSGKSRPGYPRSRGGQASPALVIHARVGVRQAPPWLLRSNSPLR